MHKMDLWSFNISMRQILSAGKVVHNIFWVILGGIFGVVETIFG